MIVGISTYVRRDIYKSLPRKIEAKLRKQSASGRTGLVTCSSGLSGIKLSPSKSGGSATRFEVAEYGGTVSASAQLAGQH